MYKTKINIFGDGISWEKHVHEILDTHDIEKIFYDTNNEEINKLKKYKTCGKVLDCGCHIGRWIEVFRGNGYDYTGIDQSYEALETAKKYKPDGKFIHCLLWNMNFDNEFDIVHTCAVLQHNKLNEQENILQKMYKALKSDGILVITEGTSLKEDITQRTHEGWIETIENHGFKFMESWHKNDIGLEDSYIFIKINTIISSSKNISKEKLKQLLLKHKVYNRTENKDDCKNDDEETLEKLARDYFQKIK